MQMRLEYILSGLYFESGWGNKAIESHNVRDSLINLLVQHNYSLFWIYPGSRMRRILVLPGVRLA